MKLAGEIDRLWRYPVKSLLGESRTELSIDRRGVVGDRWFAIRDLNGKFGSGKNTRRFRRIDRLFELQARYEGDVLLITFPDGRVIRGDDENIDRKLSQVLGQPVELAVEQKVSHFDAGSLHLVTSASLRWLQSLLTNSVIDERRFRPNFLIKLPGEDLIEHQWIGKKLKIGRELEVKITGLTERCVMAGFQQQELAHDSEIIKTIRQNSNLNFGVYAKVLKEGVARVGDRVNLL